MADYALDGKASRKKNNALVMEFVDPSGRIASATQSGSDGRKARMSILMGWRNGGPGRHAVEFTDGRSLVIEVGAEPDPVQVRDANDQVIATINAGPVSEYRTSDESLVLRIEAGGPPSKGKVPMVLRRGDGQVLATMVDVRTNTEWTARDSLRAATDLYMFLTASGATSLPMKRFGIQTSSDQPLTQQERDAVVAISVAICIGMQDLVPQA